MRNKIFDHFLQFANFSFIIGILISTILIHYNSPTDLLINWSISYIPYIILMIIGLIFATIFAIYRRNYFTLINQHITKKCIFLFKCSVYILFVNIFISIVMMFLGAILLTSNGSDGADFLQDGYLYIVLSLEIVLTLIDVAIDAVSKLKVKVDLSLRRGGSDELLKKGSEDEKSQSK